MMICLEKQLLGTQYEEIESVIKVYKKIKKYNPYHLKDNPRYVGRK